MQILNLYRPRNAGHRLLMFSMILMPSLPGMMRGGFRGSHGKKAEELKLVLRQ